ncbi:redox-regulated ATPase YchF [Erythrobacter sp. CCH5-A1]|uniref:redox-regulated ATPase YchF n=1 Tax=Erythrobacter sp. CCH5-A1 TaxID=1768792 RepID=UPI00082E99CC|nr:redox-regulated ATPase YchF [Erythrobacter sp. CCH5-A1]
MGFRCGIVGLPNVGKSTLFNALTETQAAQAANYPFCTIEPNVGQVAVPDERLQKIAAIAKSAKIIETQLGFVDIAGLVKGASKGEGLGNQFLGNIREVDAIVHVLRCFEDDDIQHVANKVDPIADAEVVETELMLSDLESLEKRVPAAAKRGAAGDKEAKAMASVLGQALELLREGKPARLTVPNDDEEARLFKQAQLLTAKPVLYVCNVAEEDAANGNDLSAKVFAKAAAEGAEAVVVSAAIEAELVAMPEEDRGEFLEALGLTESGLARVIRAGYKLLGLKTFFTAGPKEARAWTFPDGAKAPQAAGEIHSDFERGFIRAETIAYEDYITLGGEAGAKEAGKLRQEGKEYVVQDGDVLLFKFNV